MAQIPILSSTSPLEVNQALANINSLIQLLNSTLGGQINAQVGSVSTGTGTAEQTLQTWAMPANSVSRNGMALRITAWGHFATNGNNKTVQLYFGATAASSGVLTDSNKNWYAEMLVSRLTAATQNITARIWHDTALITVFNSITGTDDFTTALTIKLTGTDGTSSAGDIRCDGMITELVA